MERSMNTSSRMNASASYRESPSLNASSLSISSRRTTRIAGGSDVPVFVSQKISHILEPFGTPLPSMVKVAVNKLDENDTHGQKVSCRLDPNGWAWLVRKRKLYVWRHTSDGKRSAIPCRELVLPPSELVHHAQLVCIVATGVGGVPACIAVSPEGHISYWPNISNESATVSINADVPGQECDSLSSIWPMGCILTTTSATVLLIRPTPGNKPSLTCVSLNMASKGWLGGLAGLRTKMSYLYPSSAHLETKRAKIVIPPTSGRDQGGAGQSSTVYVLVGGSLQTWTVGPQVQQHVSEFPVDDSVRKLFHEHVWKKNADFRGIQIWLLDIIPVGNKLGILAAGMNQSETDKLLHYGIVTMDPKMVRSRSTTQFTIVDFRTPRSETDEEKLYSWKLLLNQEHFYMISEDLVGIVAGDNSFDFFPSAMLSSPFLGSGLVAEGVPLLFVPKFGLMILRAQQKFDSKMIDDSFADIRVPDHLSLSMTQNSLMDLTQSDDNVNRYKSAFLNFCGKRVDECSEILNNLFPPNVGRTTPNDPIDLWTVALCENLVDDAPLRDPRWNATLGRADDVDPMGIKSKMLIKNFLVDKKEGLELFFGFLKVTGIYDRLTGVLVREDIEATPSVLFNQYEKIRFAMILQSLQIEPKFRKILDPAVKSVILLRTEFRSTQLSYNDLFYKDVSRVHQILPALVTLEEDLLKECDPTQGPTIVSETTELILLAFVELTKGQGPNDQFDAMRRALLDPLSGVNATPWYIQAHVYEALIKQCEILTSTCKMVEDFFPLFKQLEQLTDLILDGLKDKTESLKGSDRFKEKLNEFDVIRAQLLDNLVQLDKNETMSLAEKYLDFNILLSVCHSDGDKGRLEMFFYKYADLGFPNFAFEWYIRHKKRIELIETFSLSSWSQTLLSEFIKKYPELEWHHLGEIEDYKRASVVLKDLAEKEIGSADDKKFELGMAKLALLATGEIDQDTLMELNKELEISRFQDAAPDDLLTNFGMTRKEMRVLTPAELIDVYTSGMSGDRDSVWNYWQAWCLCDYVGGCRLEKRTLVLARAILRDPWDTFSTDQPVDVIEPSLFYKLAFLAAAQGEDIDNFLNMRELSQMDILAPLFQNPTSGFLLHACYEHLSSQVGPIAMAQ